MAGGHILDFTITLTGSAQNLATVCLGNIAADKNVMMLELQPHGTNSNEIYVGGTSAVSSSSYGTRLEAADSGIPPAPWRASSDGLTAYLFFADFWVIGTNNEKLHVLAQVSA